MAKTRCPNCDTIISISNPREGTVIECAACGVELEVVRKDPFQVDFTDDWQNEWDDE